MCRSDCTDVYAHLDLCSNEAVLMSTHNLCLEQKYDKISEFLSENFQFFGGEIFSIFE